jgi:hypothetical protein
MEWFDRLIIRHYSWVSMARRIWRPLGMNYVDHHLTTPARNAFIPARSTRNVVSVHVRVSHTQWTLSSVKLKFILTINVIKDTTTWNNLSVSGTVTSPNKAIHTTEIFYNNNKPIRNTPWWRQYVVFNCPRDGWHLPYEQDRSTNICLCSSPFFNSKYQHKQREELKASNTRAAVISRPNN